MSSITVYSKPKCVQCDQTKKILDRQGTEYRTIDISLPENAEVLDSIKELGYSGAPVVIVSTLDAPDEHWYGFRLDLLMALEAPKAAA